MGNDNGNPPEASAEGLALEVAVTLADRSTDGARVVVVSFGAGPLIAQLQLDRGHAEEIAAAIWAAARELGAHEEKKPKIHLPTAGQASTVAGHRHG